VGRGGLEPPASKSPGRCSFYELQMNAEENHARLQVFSRDAIGRQGAREPCLL